MTTISHVTATMASVLGTRLSTASVDTRAFDGKFGGDGKDFTTVKAPGVLIACLGWDEVDDQVPVEIDARFFAVCIARTTAAADVSGDPRKRPADVAADLATIVARIVHVERWVDADDAPAAIGRARKIRASNDYTNALTAKGHSAWAVTWTQRVQLDGVPGAAELTNLSTIMFTLAMGPDGTLAEQLADATPDISIQVDLPEDV